MSDLGVDAVTVHQHEWIVLSAKDHIDWALVPEDAVPVEGNTGTYDVILLCPHCERTKTFRTKPLYE